MSDKDIAENHTESALKNLSAAFYFVRFSEQL